MYLKLNLKNDDLVNSLTFEVKNSEDGLKGFVKSNTNGVEADKLEFTLSSSFKFAFKNLFH